jgi:hypothetical protein
MQITQEIDRTSLIDSSVRTYQKQSEDAKDGGAVKSYLNHFIATNSSQTQYEQSQKSTVTVI